MNCDRIPSRTRKGGTTAVFLPKRKQIQMNPAIVRGGNHLPEKQQNCELSDTQ